MNRAHIGWTRREPETLVIFRRSSSRCCVARASTHHPSTHVPIRAPERCSVAVARFLLEFWRGPDGCLRPLTNANVLLDFSRYKAAPYFDLCVKYLAKYSTTVNYARQISEVHSYLCRTRILHRYADFSLVGAVSSAPNTKQLQRIGHANDDAVSPLARAHFYKYRATSLAFGFHAQSYANETSGLHSLRKNCY